MYEDLELDSEKPSAKFQSGESGAEESSDEASSPKNAWSKKYVMSAYPPTHKPIVNDLFVAATTLVKTNGIFASRFARSPSVRSELDR